MATRTKTIRPQAPGDKDLEKALRVLVKHLQNDTEYRYGWQANIAMAVMDVIRDKRRKKRVPLSNAELHQAVNVGAQNFLDLLTYATTKA